MSPTFIKLNHGWNAEPNAPAPVVSIGESSVVLRFDLNHFVFKDVSVDDAGCLAFTGCSRYRLGPTNDDGWWLGQCRYSGIAPSWGDFYEISGDDPLLDQPDDWRVVRPDVESSRHFLFYLRDHTFECMAHEWSYAVERNFGEVRGAIHDALSDPASPASRSMRVPRLS